MEINIGEHCTHCGKDTSIDSKNLLFANRIPSGADGKLILTNASEDSFLEVTVLGYMCAECQSIECDMCNQKVLEYELNFNKVICIDCLEKQENKNE